MNQKKRHFFLFGVWMFCMCASIACLATAAPNVDLPKTQVPTQDPDPDRDGILGKLDQCPKQPETVNGIFDTDGCPDNLQSLIDLARQDIDQFWRHEFAGSHFSYVSPNTIRGYSDSHPLETACGETVPDNAFYCSEDNSIYYDEDLLGRILKAKNYGDFGTVVVLAHEWGHLAQADLRITRRNLLSIELELQADCFAGAYARYLAQQNSKLLSLDKGDLEEGAKVLYALGDDQVAWFDPQAHGTPQQRMSAYAIGLNKGTTGCLTLGQ
jgi:predicted metalloprotease